MIDVPPFPWYRLTAETLPAEYAHVAARNGVLRVELIGGQPVWLFGSYDTYRRLMTDPAVSADHSHPHYPAMSSVKRSRASDGARPLLAYSGLDGEEHTHHRRLVDWAFATQRIEAVDGALAAVVEHELDEAFATGQRIDVAENLSVRIAIRCIMVFLGVPGASRSELGGVLAGLAAPELTMHRRQVLGQRLRTGVMTASGTANGRPGSVWEVLNESYGSGPLFSEMTASLLIAGTETMARAVCSGLLVLRGGGDEAGARLVDTVQDRDRTVDEVLRVCGVADLASMRVAATDFEVCGHHIPRGDALVGLSALADRDVSVFPEPTRLDFTRERRSLAFGHGVHRCLGKHLARAVLWHTWAGLVRRGALHRPLTVRWPGPSLRPLLYGPSALTLNSACGHSTATGD